MKIIYFDTVSSQIPRETTLEMLAKSLRSSDLLRRRTEDYRAALAEDKDSAAQLKKGFQGFLPAAIVSEKRARKYVTALTGLVMCDFDHVPLDRLADIRAKVNADPHTVLTYVTLSGEGLRVLAGYSLEEMNREVADQASDTEEGRSHTLNLTRAENFYRKMFTAINQYYARLIGCDFDPACKDLSRLSFVAFDAEAFFHPEAQLFMAEECNVSTGETRKKKKKEKSLKNKTINLINETYKWKIKPLVEQDGVKFEPGSHNNFVMRVGYMMNKYGFELKHVCEWAQKAFAAYGEAAEVITRCYARTEEHGEWSDRVRSIDTGSDTNKLPRANRMDIIGFLKDHVEVRRNLIRGLTEMRWKNPEYEGIASANSTDRHSFTHDTDAMVKSILCQIEEKMGLDASREKVYDVIENDMIVEYDPLVDFLKSLPQWDPDKDPDYLAELAATVRILDPDPQAADLFARCLKKWFVAMLVGWTRPDKVNETALYFVGAQGTYKSTWMRNLLSPVLQEYVKVKQNCSVLTTDDIIAMSQFGQIILEESDAMNAQTYNMLKAMLSTLHSDERAPYGRAPKRRNNIATLCATGNNERFLINDQGTRRMLVFRVEVIQSPLDHPFNYEGIYSQAYYLMQNGFQYYFSKEEQAELERHNKQFELESPEENGLDLTVRKPRNNEVGEWWRPGQIAIIMQQRLHMHFDANKVGVILTSMGFKSTYHRGKKGYQVVLLDYDESKRIAKERSVQSVSLEADSLEPEEPQPMDISQAPLSIQEGYSRLLGEKDEDN
jgi:hypothetical protein